MTSWNSAGPAGPRYAIPTTIHKFHTNNQGHQSPEIRGADDTRDSVSSHIYGLCGAIVAIGKSAHAASRSIGFARFTLGASGVVLRHLHWYCNTKKLALRSDRTASHGYANHIRAAVSARSCVSLRGSSQRAQIFPQRASRCWIADKDAPHCARSARLR